MHYSTLYTIEFQLELKKYPDLQDIRFYRGTSHNGPSHERTIATSLKRTLAVVKITTELVFGRFLILDSGCMQAHTRPKNIHVSTDFNN